MASLRNLFEPPKIIPAANGRQVRDGRNVSKEQAEELRREREPTRAEATKRALADPAVRAKMSAATKRAWAEMPSAKRSAVRAKMSAATKRAWAEWRQRRAAAS